MNICLSEKGHSVSMKFLRLFIGCFPCSLRSFASFDVVIYLQNESERASEAIFITSKQVQADNAEAVMTSIVRSEDN